MANSTQGRRDFIFGSSRFEHQSTAAPSSHASLTGRRLDPHPHTQTRESTGVSESPKQEPWFDMYFDYPSYNQGGSYEGETDVTTQSDLFSEGSPETTPSAVTTESSVGTGPDLDEDTEMPDAPVSPVPHNNENVWPKVSNTDLPRHPIIHDNDDLTPHSEATPTPMPPPLRHSQARRPSGASASPGKKTRRVPEPQKTSKVRENGACTLCKGSRVSCSVDGVCGGCTKLCEGSGVDPAKVCIRRVLQDSVGSLNRWCPDTTSSQPLGTFQSNSSSIPILIFTSDDPQSPYLQVQAMRSQRGLVIIPESGQSHHKAISEWARKQSRASANRSFDSFLQQLLAVFVEAGALDHANDQSKKSGGVFVSSQNYWMERLLKMRCMWDVWNCRRFHVRDARGGQPLQDSTQPIHEYLHGYAGQRISELERDVLKEIDKLQGGIKVGDHPTPLLLSAYHLGVWVSLWQLALMYRHSSGSPLALRKKQFRETTEELYNKVVVLYSVIFRTSKALLYLVGDESGVLRVFGGKSAVAEAFEKAWRAHKEFYNSFKQQYPGDELIQKLVVGKEAKVLGRKRPNRK